MSDSVEEKYPDTLPKHKIYEMVVANVIQRLDPISKVKHDAQVPVVGDDRKRQVDVYVQGQVGGFPIDIVFDSKYYKRKLDVKDVDSFLGMMDDLKPSMGVLISLTGFTSGAVSRAAKEGNRVNLCSIFDADNIEYSYPLTVTAFQIKRTGKSMRISFTNGTNSSVQLFLPSQESLFEVENKNRERFRVFDLAWRELQIKSDWQFVENGKVSLDVAEFQLVNGASLLQLSSLEVEFYTTIEVFRRKLPFVEGTAIVDKDGKINASTELKTDWTDVTDLSGWDQVTLEDAKKLASKSK